MEKISCPYCGQENFAESEICWACYKDLRPPRGTPPAPKEPVAPAADPVEEPAGSVRGALGRLALALALALFYAQWWRVENYFSPLDHINLAFHEAGHIFLGFFGQFIMTAGGTIFQLLFPAVCGVHLWRQGSRLGWQLCLFWFGENLLNISIYAGDAINQALPLLGGGVHDWTYLLTETGLIAHTRGTARAIFAAGSAVIFCSLFSLVRDGLGLLSSGGRGGAEKLSSAIR
jgi:hypothetical protein